MMREIISELNECKKSPIAKVIHKGNDFKVIGLGLNKGVILKDHNTPSLKQNVNPKNVLLLVIKGKIKYTSKHRNIILDTYDKMEIPINEIHAVEGIDDAVFLIILC